VKVFGLPQEQFYVDYLLLMVRNLIRFVGDDFAFAGCANAQEVYPCLCLQEIGGAESASTAICCDEDVFAVLASRYAGEEISSADEFAEACVGELLNLQNGLFAVNRSNSAGVELELTPQQALRNAQVPVGAVAVRLAYSFGTVTIAVKKI
ncbi:MAG: chemotaxis protein CheX, partial [Oscillospiraceae bacterium]|nr:chemotaxis protein CheX [Oscillospiraceae bacterium]